MEPERVGEGWCGESEACKEEPKVSREFCADLKMGVGKEGWPWLSVLRDGGVGECSLSLCRLRPARRHRRSEPGRSVSKDK